MLHKVKKVFLRVLYNYWLKTKMNNDVIVFESFLGRNYSDNPKSIFEYMRDNNYNYKYVWVVKKEIKIEGATIVLRGSKEYFKYLATSKYIISNSRMPLSYKKRKNQIYLQTWHGTPLKKLVYDLDQVLLPGTNTKKYLENFSKDVSKWDYLVSPNEYSTSVLSNAFRFEKEVIETGYPRNDRLINYSNQEVEKIKDDLQIDKNKKVLLYAPTFRDNEYENKGKYNQKLMLDFKALQTEASDWIILLRTHYLVTEIMNVEQYSNVVNVSDYCDINDLYLVADSLMTDYSSVFFDYANLNRPMIFHAYDLESYEKDLRGFYFDYEDNIPGDNIKDTKDLINILNNIEVYKKNNQEKLNTFNKKFNVLEDGKSSEKVLEKIGITL